MAWKKITSIALLLCMLLSMFTIAMPTVGAASADKAETSANVELAETGATVSSGTVIYFDASNYTASGTVIQFMIGHGSWSQGYPMTKVSNSNLYYVKMDLWEGATEYAIFGCNEEWGGEGSSVTSRKSWAPWSTAVMTASDLSGTVILTANSSGTLSKSSASLNTTHTATACYQSSGGGSYSTGTTGGTVKVSGYNVSGTTGSAKSSSTSGTGISVGIGTTVTMTATAATGYTFKGWFTSTTATSATSTSATYTYTNTGSATTLYAKFQLNGPYTVTVLTNGTSYGTVSTSSTSAYYGKTVTLTATPKTGYHLSSWAITSGTGSLSSTTATSPTLTVKSAITAKATFAANTGTVSFSAGTGGSVSSTGGSTTYSGTKSSTATASTGYYFTGWTISGGTLNTDYKITSGSTSSTSITIQPITNGVTITCKANFSTQYSITANRNYGVLGTVSASTSYVTPGNTVTLTASPDSGNGFNKWTISGSYTISSGSLTSTTITITPTSNITATANFYAGLTVSAGTGGSVSPSGKNLYSYNAAVTITATPSTGYHFTSWTFGGTYTGGSTTSASTTIYVQDCVTATANFAINTYTVTFKNWDGTVLKTQTVNHGSAATAPSNPTRAATAQYTYTFAGWDKSYSSITADTTITATYTSSTNKYTVTFKDWDGTTLKTQSVAYGSAATAPSNPTRTGYEFTGWDKDFTNITGALTVTAQYKDVQYYLMGDMNSWGGNVMTESNGIASYSIHLEPGTYEFKITRDGTWWGNGGTIVDTTLNTSSTGWDMYTDAGNCTLSTFGGTYTFNFNTSTNKLEVLYDPDRYTVTFFNWDGTLLQTGVVMEGSAASYTGSTPTKAGDAQYSYTFSGWDKSFSNVQSTLDIYAQFTQTTNKYTVTFVNYDGTTLATQSVAYGSAATYTGSTPTKPSTAQYSYTFSGWDKSFTNITGNLTVTAQYTSAVRSYTVTFKNYDGTVLKTQSVAYGSAATAPSNPTRPATAQYTYTFTGWDKTFTNITGDLTVTAQYSTTTNKYTVTFVNYDGTVLKTQSVEYGSAATAPTTTPTRPADAQYTYTFSGWDKSYSNITGNLTVTAQYSTTTNKYTVTFVNYDGTVLKTQLVAYGSAATAPTTTPTKPSTVQYSYTFSGWDKSFTNITGDLTVTAQFTSTVNKYTVTFVNYDGTVLKTQSVAYGSAATAPSNPTRPADAQYTYTFTGWDKSYSNITGDLTVTAQYGTTTNKYTVKFVDWNGKELSTQSVAYGSAATAPANPTRTGYEFTGWDKDFTNITGALTVTAQYMDVQLYLMGDFNGWASSTPMTESTGNIVTISVTLDAGTYGFKIMKGDTGIWYGNAGTIEDTTLATSSIGWEMYDWEGSNCTLKAKGGTYTFNFNTETRFLEVLYAPYTYTVTFVNWDGTVLKTQTVNISEDATAPSNPTRTATAQYTYTFKGWDTDFTNVQSDLTVTATYTSTVNKYTVTFKNWDGTVLKTQSVEYGSAATAPSNPTRTGYEFTGWDTDFTNITGATTVTAQFVDASVYLLGSFNGWAKDTVMATKSGNIVTATLDLEAGTYTFKILHKEVWYGNYGTIADTTTATSSVGWEMVDGADDCTLTATGGMYVFNYNTSTHFLEVLYVPEAFKVTFKNWDGTVLKTEAVNKGESAAAPSNPGREATAQYTYTFAGWDTDFSNIQADTVVTATYTATVNKYTVTFKNWDGTVLSTQSIAYGSSATAPANPTRTADVQYTYTFSGWSGSYTNITGDTTVTATYTSTVNKYTVTFKNWDGTVLSTQSIAYGSSATAPANPTRTGDAQYSYTFAGWDKSFTNITGELTVTATYTSTVNKYTVTFVNWDGTVLSTQSIEYGSAATAPENPSRDGYVFTGWDKEFTNITGDTVVTAQYEEVQAYLLGSFNNWESSTPMEKVGGNVVTTTITLSEGTYIFKILQNGGWYGNWGTIEDTTTATSEVGWEMVDGADNCTLTATGGTYTFNFNTATKMLEVLFTPPSYTVTFKDYDGTVLKTESVVRGSNATAPSDPTRSGYVFTGWDTDFTSIKANTTVTAQYVEDVVYLLGSFNGWEKTTVMTGTGNVVSVTLTLEAGTYTFKILDAVKWLGNSGIIEDTTTVTSGVGWEMTENTDDCTLTATGGTYTFKFNKETYMLEVLFTPPSYTVTFVDYNGSTIKTETVVRGSSATAPADPVRDGYVFIGWNKGFTNVQSDLTVTAQYAEDAVYLVGDFNNWVLDTEMTESGTDGILSVTLELSEGSYQFKILNVATWYGNTGTIDDSTVKTSDTGWAMIEGNDNCTLKASGGTYTFNYNPVTNTLEILFTPPSYTVTFKDWDGTVLKTETVVRGSSATAPADPVRDGYIFQGWNKDFSYIYTNTVVTATYLQQKITYTVTFLGWDGTVLSTQIVTTGEAATAPAAPERENYAFVGWDKDFSNITYNLTVNAIYEDTRVYLVGTFNDWHTDTVMTVTDNGDIVSVELILEAGTYNFKILYKDVWYTNQGTIEDTTLATSDIGWEMTADSSVGDCTLIATGGKYTFNYNTATRFLEIVYTAVEYTVTFLDYDGTLLSTDTVKLGAGATAPASPAREGYVFAGWNTDYSHITGDLTVTATYVEDTTLYTITFVDFDGRVLSTQYVTYGKAAVSPASPSRTGYVFTGWDTDFSCIKADTTVTAQYKDNTVYLYGSFNTWAEGIVMTATEGSDVVTYEMTLPEGKYFFKLLNLDSWYGNTGNIADTTQTTSDIGWEMILGASNCTLTASGGKYIFSYNPLTKLLIVQYTPIEYTVVFKGFDGEVLSTQTVRLGADATAPEAAEIGGYIFSGWDKSYTDITADTEINAVYLVDDTKFTVTFVDYDGTVISTQEVEYGESATAPADPTRTGYIFIGWDKDFSNITLNTVVTAQYKDNQIYLIGSFNDWATDLSMTREGTSNVFSVQIMLEAGFYEFKLLQNDEWYTNASTIIDTTTATSSAGIELVTNQALGNIYLNATGGLYTFRFNVLTSKLEVLHSTEKYTVTFVDYDGTVLATVTVNGGAAATAPASPTRVGNAQYSYTFAGWDKSFSSVTEDMTVTATYTQTVNSYTVMFVDTDGTVLSSQTVEYGAAATAPDAPSKDGYIFQGWDTDFSYITTNTVVTAKFIAGIASSVTLAGTFNGWNSSANPFLITTDSDKVTLQLKLDEGTYQFKVVDNGSWYGNWGTIADTTVTTSDIGWEMDASAGDCTLIAGGGTYIFTYTISTHMLEVEYIGSEFKVTFVDWDGTVLKTEVVEPGGSATAPDVTLTRPEDDGYTYTFAGWDMDFTNVIAPLRVTAVYNATAKMYTVNFVNWNGAVLKTQSVAYGTAATPPSDPTRTGYIFTGWDGDIWYITGNTTFTAQYADNGVYLMGDFNDWAGTKLTLVSGTTYQVKITLSAGQYKFKVKQGDSWYGNNGWIDDTTTYTSDVGWEMSWDAGDCTLNASGSTYTFRFNTSTRMLEVLYVAPTYTVTFKDWNGTTLKTQYVTRGNSAYAPSDPTRSGYIFTGWDRDFSWIYENTVVTATYAKNEVNVMGDFNSWEGTAMALSSGTVYTATLYLEAGSYKFKIKHIDTWYGNNGTIDNTTTATSDVGWEMTGDAGDCTLNASGGTYTFRFNTSTRMLEIFYVGQVYTVTFLDWDGSIISTQQVEYGYSATAPANPVRDGYTFSGWSADFSYITGNTTITALYGDEAVYLRGTFNNWELSTPMRATDTANVYTYVFELEAGSYTFKVFRSDVWYGNNGTIEDTTTVTSATGWEMDSSAGDCTLVAQGGTYLFRYNVETRMLEIIRVTEEVTVTFVDYDGTVISTQTVKYGDAATAPTGLVRDGYVFTGWDKAIDYITESITVTALYRKTVVLNGSFADAGLEMTNTEGTLYKTTIAIDEGTYTFDINYGGVIYSASSTFADATEGLTMVTDSGKCTIIASGGIYRFTFDTETNTLIVERISESTEDEIVPDTPVIPDDGDDDDSSTNDELDPDAPSGGDEEDPDTPPSGDDDEEEPVIPEIPVITHTVIFVDKYGNILSEQIIIDGEAANAPTPPTISGYEFIGWSKLFDIVTSDLIVTAQYKRVSVPVVITTGILQIDVVSGTGFKISIDGGAYRAQGLSYLNSKAPIGVSVTVIANTTSGKEFVGWVNAENGRILTSKYTYTFVTTGNDHIKALFLTDYVGMNSVMFVNSMAASNSGQILDMQYYAPGDTIIFPLNPTQVGYTFTGWDMTAAEIQAKLEAGEDVTVLATWVVEEVYYEVSIIGGTGKGNTDAYGKYLANYKVTITADEAPEGMKFAYWTVDGEIMSYSTTYALYPSKALTVEAVFVEEDVDIDYQILVNIDAIDTTTTADRNVFYYSWYVPEEELGVTYVTAGILAVNKNAYTGDNLVIGTSDSGVYNRTPSAAYFTPAGAYAWTKTNISSGDTWVARAYVQYKIDGSDEIIVVYSDVVEATKA